MKIYYTKTIASEKSDNMSDPASSSENRRYNNCFFPPNLNIPAKQDDTSRDKIKSSKEEISKDETSKEETSVLENQVDNSDFFNPVCLNNRDNMLIIDNPEGGSDFDSKRLLDFKKKKVSEKYMLNNVNFYCEE